MLEFLYQVVEKVAHHFFNFSRGLFTRTDELWTFRLLTVSRPNMAATRAALIHRISSFLAYSMEEVGEVNADCAADPTHEVRSRQSFLHGAVTALLTSETRGGRVNGNVPQLTAVGRENGD